MLLTVLLVSFGAFVESSNFFRYDYNYNKDAEGWLKLHQIPATFHDAFLRCQLEGAILASPTDAVMDMAMRKEINDCQLSCKRVFTGIHATFSRGDFFSIDGIPIHKMKLEWMHLEPDNNNNDEDCILFSSNGTVADISCNEVHPYICYKKKDKSMHVTSCGTVDKEYTFEAETGSCYKFHRVARNWTRAFMTCAAEGGHLAVINCEAESKIVRAIFEKNPINTLPRNLRGVMKDIVHIGFHDWGERGAWTTIHGTALNEVGFNIWAEGQPDNASPGEHCGGMFRNGRLDDVWCNENGPFICEKSPESLYAEEAF